MPGDLQVVQVFHFNTVNLHNKNSSHLSIKRAVRGNCQLKLVAPVLYALILNALLKRNQCLKEVIGCPI